MEFPKPIPYLLLLCFMCLSANSARLLDEQPQVPVGTPAASSIVGSGTLAASSGVGTPIGNLGTGTTTTTTTTPSTTLPSSGGIEDDHHTLTFFMHDILGGSNPSARAVTGAVNNPALNGQLPFAKPNGAVLSVGNNVPQSNGNSGLINNNNLPFLLGLGGATSSPLLQNSNGGGNNFNAAVGFPSVNAGQLPSGVSIQQLMFGTMTVIDDELTEGHELGSGLIGKAQGFYVVSSEDGNSQTMAFTTMFESGHYVDSLSFFGVHRTAVSESHLAIMGGTGKYVNAKGYANVKTLPGTNQHETDGVETLLQFTVYITY